MKTIRTYYKNSNTGALIKKISFEDTEIDFGDNFYDCNGNPLENPCLKGFVKMSQKKFQREVKKTRNK